MSKLGATGEFPDGKISEDDEGALNTQVASWQDQVRIDFGKPVAWFSFPPNQAIEFAMVIISHANRIKENSK